jgi:hypothetical protein
MIAIAAKPGSTIADSATGGRSFLFTSPTIKSTLDRHWLF